MSNSLDLETPPIWLWDRPIASIRAGLRGHIRADVLVVGAGMAGTAAAYYLTELRPDLVIVLVDALHVGSGATGHSTGIVGPGVSAPLRSLRRRYGDEATADAFDSTVEGAAEVRRLVAAEDIDCDARLEQHVIGALTEAQERRMHRHTADLAALGRPVGWWDDQTVARCLGVAYRSAFAYDDVLLVNPYLLVTGLAAVAELRGVRIFERTRVTSLDHRTDAVYAHTPGGIIAAGQVLLAVDGYAGALNPHPSSVVPVRTHVLATAPLTDRQRADLGWDGIGGVIDQRKFFDYYRLGAGDRLIFGGGPAVFPTGDPQRDSRSSAVAYRTVEARLRERFPSLRGVAIQARWSGLTGGTLDRLPVVGALETDRRIHFAGGWCGHGLAMCVDTARRYSQLLAHPGKTSAGAQLPWFRSGTAGLPTAALRSVALPGYLRAMDVQDRVSLALARRRSRPLSRPLTPDRPAAAAESAAELDVVGARPMIAMSSPGGIRK